MIIKLTKRIRHRFWSRDEKLLLSTRNSEKLCVQILYEFQGECKKVTEDNVTDCLNIEDEHYLEVYRNMLKHGDYGVYGYLDNVMVFREWAQLSGYLKCSRQHTIFFGQGSNNAFIHYVYCKPFARKNGFQTNATNKLMQDLSGKVFYATVMPDNYTSLRNFYKCGLAIESLLIVKNRFGIRIRKEKLLSEEEKHRYENKFLE